MTSTPVDLKKWEVAVPGVAIITEDFHRTKHTSGPYSEGFEFDVTFKEGQIFHGHAIYANGRLANFVIDNPFPIDRTKWRLGRHESSVQWRLLTPLELLAMQAE